MIAEPATFENLTAVAPAGWLSQSVSKCVAHGSSQSGSLVGFWAQLETQLQVLGPHELLRLR